MTTQRPVASTAPTTAGGKAPAHPLVWLAVGIVSISITTALFLGIPTVGPLLAGGAALVLYRQVMRRLARRPTPELGRMAPEALRGVAVGVVFIGLSMLVAVALGGYEIEWRPHGDVLSTVLVACGAAVCEELIFRGIAFRAIETMSGPGWALALTSAFFGLAHLFNPGASLWSAIAIAVEAGVVLGAAFLWRRNLWFCIGLHAAWNAVVGLLGVPVSGRVEPSLFISHAVGPSWLTGGAFGIEASVIPVILSLALSALLLLRARPMT